MCVCTFSGANLKGVDMEGSQMTGINLRVATLKNAKLKNCNLRGATLAGTDLEVNNHTLTHKLTRADTNIMILKRVWVSETTRLHFFARTVTYRDAIFRRPTWGAPMWRGPSLRRCWLLYTCRRVFGKPSSSIRTRHHEALRFFILPVLHMLCKPSETLKLSCVSFKMKTCVVVAGTVIGLSSYISQARFGTDHGSRQVFFFLLFPARIEFCLPKV